MANEALILEGVDAFYGDSHTLHNVSFALHEGRLLGLLGRNGAGKTTCLNVTMGFIPARRGQIRVFGTDIAGFAPENVAAQGVALVPQGRRIFRNLTVRENLAIAAQSPCWGKMRKTWTLPTVYETFPRLSERQHQLSGYLSGGEQQMLAIARALMRNPRVLLMDEPSEGLAPQIIAEVMATIRSLKELCLSIILIEQNARLVFDLADDIVVLNTGRVVVDGEKSSLVSEGFDPAKYLGLH